MTTVTINITEKFYACPTCQGRLTKGRPRFGPDLVKCGWCGANVQTSLKPWASCTKNRRIYLGLRELVDSNDRLGLGYMVRTLLTLWMSLCLVMCAGSLLIFALSPIALATGNPDMALLALEAGTAMFILFFVFGPLYPAYQLNRMIKESNKYSKTKTPPIWKYLRIKQPNEISYQERAEK